MNVNHFTQFESGPTGPGKIPDSANETAKHKNFVVHKKASLESIGFSAGFSKALGMAFCMLFSLFAHAQTTENFIFSGAVETWVVPPNVTSINIESWGAQGGDAAGLTAGGLGGYASGDLCVYPGQVINIYVGGAGCEETTGTLGCGGFNGGGDAIGVSVTDSRGGGGGASDVRVGGATLASRVIVAGGGGGACGRVATATFVLGGDGGGLIGGDGQNTTGESGEGGSQISGGISNAVGASPGVFGNGGAPIGAATLGGGGGGWYGGGGGCGAGGGSGYIGGVTNGSMNNGVRSGNGLVQITYDDSEQISNLSCISDLHVAIDADCMVRITPNMVLGDGNYLCNQFYNVVVTGLTPISAISGNNSPEVIIDASQLDGFFEEGMSEQFEVMVINPTDNNNMCVNDEWMIIDGYKPDICCSDFEISCLDPTHPSQITGLTKTYNGVGGATVAPVGGEAFGLLEIEFEVTECDPIEDVNVSFEIEYVGVGDLSVDLVGPGGSPVVSLLDRLGVSGANPAGCQSSDLVLLFDDASSNPYSDLDNMPCPTTTPAFSGDYHPQGDLADFNGLSGEGTWTLRVRDYTSATNGLVVNPSITIGADYANPFVFDCSKVTLWHTDDPLDPSILDICDGQPIIRTWIAEDVKGKRDTCEQTITVIRPTLGEIDCPLDTIFSCLLSIPDDPDKPGSPDPDHTGEPTYEGIPISGLCMFLVSYEDNYSFDACNELWMRTWKVTDMCSNSSTICMQVIKRVDDEGPDFDAPADVSLSPPLFSNCQASYQIPDIVITDVCSPDNQFTYVATPDPLGGVWTNDNGTYTYSELEIGNSYTVTFTAFDGCGNSSTDDFTITVDDFTSPEPACSPETIALNSDGTAFILAENFATADSKDNCGIVDFQIRRVTDCAGDDTDPTIFYPFVEFECCDAGEMIEVELYAEDAAGLSNTVTCTVTVMPFSSFGFTPCPDTNGGDLECEDYKTTLQTTFVNVDPNPPANGPSIPVKHIDIDGFENNVGYYNPNAVNSSSCANFEVTIVDVADLTPPCNTGTVERTYTLTSGLLTASCDPIIYTIVNNTVFTEANNIDWPDDVLVPGLDCADDSDPADLDADSDFPDLINLTACHGAQVRAWELTHDDIFPGEDDDDFCYKIRREWLVIDWCSTPPGQEYYHYQYIMVVDNELPTLTCSGPQNVTEGDPVVATATATDNCTSIANLSLNFRYEIDIDNDGSDPFAANDADPGNDASGPSGVGTNFPVGEHIVRFYAEDQCGNVGTCDITVVVEPAIDCDDLTTDLIIVDAGAEIGGNLDADDSDFYIGSAPAGVMISKDGVDGNETLSISFGCGDIDLNAPTTETVYLHLPNGLICPRDVVLIDGTQPDLGCSQFSKTIDAPGATGNVDLTTPINQETLIGIPADECTSFNNLIVEYTLDDGSGTVITELPCGSTTDIIATVKDQFTFDVTVPGVDGNPNSCPITVTIDCSAPPPISNVSGAIANEEDDLLENVTISPAAGLDVVLTDVNGVFQMNLPTNENYEITPTKDDDFLNGVSTYDIVLMSKHLLDIQLLETPYKIIAGDVNNNGTITTIDMVELRKVILFINDEFPNNSSWRFVDGTYIFPDATNPFLTIFPETYTINGLNGDMTDLDFVAVKVGDVNCSATTNGFAGDADGRDFNGTLQLEMNDMQLAAGQTHTIEVKARDFNNMLGYQFTMAFDELEVVDVVPGVLPNLTAGNFGMQSLQEGVMTTSWNSSDAVNLEDGEVLFSLVVKATKGLTLSDVLRASSRYTTAEAYADKGTAVELLDVNLAFRNEGGIQVASQFELYQNRPNPFKDETVIGFDLPQGGFANIKVYDLSGRVLTQVEGAYQKGYNEVSISRSDLPGTGVLYYELTTGKNTAVRKMTIID